MSSLADLKGKYKGNRLFVVGTGPSLAKVDLNLLKGEHIFGLNALMVKYQPPWVPQFYGVVEGLSTQTPECIQSLRLLHDNPTCTIFLGDERAREGEIKGFQRYVFVPCSAANDMREVSRWWDRWCGWAGFDGHGMRDGTVSLDLGVQVGYWMGFNPIYLLGSEYTEERRRGFQDVMLSRESATVVARMLAERGVKLVNLSDGCKADMPMQDWREVLEPQGPLPA